MIKEIKMFNFTNDSEDQIEKIFKEFTLKKKKHLRTKKRKNKNQKMNYNN